MNSNSDPATSPRGYILLEVVMGGAMAAVIIAGILTTVAHTRAKNVYAARDVTASQLVLERLEERRALGYAAVTAMSETPVTGVVGRYDRVTAVTDCVETVPAPGANTNCRDITVTVSYTATDVGAGGGTIRRSQATARVYQ